MRLGYRSLIAGTALLAAMTGAEAADLPPMPSYTAPAAAPYIFDWSGHYIGVHGLYIDGDFKSNLTPGVTFNFDGDFFGGGQIGWNWQKGRLVYGVEASGSFGSLAWTAPTQSVKISSLGMFRGKIGYAFDYPLFTNIIPLKGHTTDHFMIYATGGVAVADWKGTVFGTGSDRGMSTGWTVGVGVEKRFWDTVSLTLEYDYVDFGNVTLDAGGGPSTLDGKGNIFKVGLNFRHLWDH